MFQSPPSTANGSPSTPSTLFGNTPASNTAPQAIDGSQALSGLGLQLPATSFKSTSTPRPGSPENADGRAGARAGMGIGDRGLTNVDALNDAVGIAGVDIHAEEEGLRLANERPSANASWANRGGVGDSVGAAGQPQPPPQMIDRSRKQNFIEPGVLAEAVKKIAASFQLRTLEPDTIPFIALATRHRLMSLINSSIAARDHRLNASHLRLPPFVNSTRRHSHDRSKLEKATEDISESDGESDSDAKDGDSDSSMASSSSSTQPNVFHNDPNGNNGNGMLVDGEDRKPSLHKRRRHPRKRAKTNGVHSDINTPKKVPAWDQVIFDQLEKLLSALERVDREEERKKRRERMVRDEKEQAEKELAEAVAASEAAQMNLDTGGTGTPAKRGVGGLDGSRSTGGAPGTPMGQGTSGPNTPRDSGGDETPLGKDGKPRKQKRPKKETPATAARNMSEDVKKRLTDQVAMRSLGGRSFAWLNASPASGPGALASPSPASSGQGILPRPKFAPISSLPPPSFASPLGSSTLGNSTTGATGLSRLSNVPPLHDVNREKMEKEDWEKAHHLVESVDLIWAMERERGMGVGRGSGRNTLFRARAGAKPISLSAPPVTAVIPSAVVPAAKGRAR